MRNIVEEIFFCIIITNSVVFYCSITMAKRRIFGLYFFSGLSWAFGTSLKGVILIGRPGAGRKSAVRLAATYSSLRLINSGPGTV